MYTVSEKDTSLYSQLSAYFGNESHQILPNFDVIIDFADKQRDETFQKIHDEIQKEFPDYNLNITLDYDISD